jgi:putative PIN family toxin of toxin-antitoxin system
MIRIVMDTNVIVSAFIGMAKEYQDAYPRRIFQAIEDELVLPLTSVAAIEELEEVLNRPHIAKRHRKTTDEVAQDIDRFTRLCEFVIDEISVTIVEEDPDDDLFLAIAKTGQAQVVISGDVHLLDLKEFHDIPIMTPKQFVDAFLPTTS